MNRSKTGNMNCLRVGVGLKNRPKWSKNVTHRVRDPLNFQTGQRTVY